MTAHDQPTAPPPRPGRQYVIKKYPNRRLYDTTTSSYITLAEVKQLVMRHCPIIVRDAKTDEDLTRSILLQIILEEEAGGTPMFSETMLANIIRFYGHAMQSHMGRYIESNVQMLTDLQRKMAPPGGNPAEAWLHMVNMQNPMLQPSYAGHMKKMQEQLQKQTEQVMEIFGVKYPSHTS